MFTPEQRSAIRSALLERAANDHRISGAAITGSGAAAREDEWSDIDLAFGVGTSLGAVLAEWTKYMYEHHEALHHTDVAFGAWIYRVFLLANTLQVDLAFVPATEFRALGPTFRLIFGQTNEPIEPPAAQPDSIIGMAWLHALHARSSIARGQLWQAEYMISGIRDNALALACLRHGLPSIHGRGMDQLPSELAATFESALVRRLDPAELSRAFQSVTNTLLNEIQCVDEQLAERLKEALTTLTES